LKDSLAMDQMLLLKRYLHAKNWDVRKCSCNHHPTHSVSRPLRPRKVSLETDEIWLLARALCTPRDMRSTNHSPTQPYSQDHKIAEARKGAVGNGRDLVVVHVPVFTKP
jgi:hypothetical protein